MTEKLSREARNCHIAEYEERLWLYWDSTILTTKSTGLGLGFRLNWESTTITTKSTTVWTPIGK